MIRVTFPGASMISESPWIFKNPLQVTNEVGSNFFLFGFRLRIFLCYKVG